MLMYCEALWRGCWKSHIMMQLSWCWKQLQLSMQHQPCRLSIKPSWADAGNIDSGSIICSGHNGNGCMYPMELRSALRKPSKLFGTSLSTEYYLSTCRKRWTGRSCLILLPSMTLLHLHPLYVNKWWADLSHSHRPVLALKTNAPLPWWPISCTAVVQELIMWREGFLTIVQKIKKFVCVVLLCCHRKVTCLSQYKKKRKTLWVCLQSILIIGFFKPSELISRRRSKKQPYDSSVESFSGEKLHDNILLLLHSWKHHRQVGFARTTAPMCAFEKRCKGETWVGAAGGVAHSRIVSFLEGFPQSHEGQWAAESDTSPHKHRRPRLGELLTPYKARSLASGG